MAIRGTTPIYTLTVEGYDLTDTTIVVSVENGRKRIELAGTRLNVTHTSASGTDPEYSTIVFVLTQRETLSLSPGSANVEAKWIDLGGNVKGAKSTQPITIVDTSIDHEIAYDGGD